MNLETERYINRTVEHIHRVQKNMATLVTVFQTKLFLSDEDVRALMHQVMMHDNSKFCTSQYGPYIHLTEYYHQRRVLGNKEYQYPSDEIKHDVDIAVLHHYASENHHAEGETKYWNKLNALECACDLQAMAQELGEGSARGFFKNVWIGKSKNLFESEQMFCSMAFWIEQAIECFEQKTQGLERNVSNEKT